MDDDAQMDEELAALAAGTRARAYVMIHGGGAIEVVETPEVVRDTFAAHSDSEWVQFTGIALLGNVGTHSMRFEPMGVWIERGSIYGCGEITEAKWRDRLMDYKQQAMVPTLSMPGLQIPGR